MDNLHGKVIATLFRNSCHMVVVGARSTTLSADYPGPARKLIENAIDGIAIFMQRCGRNLNDEVGIEYEEDCSDTNFRAGITRRAHLEDPRS